MAQLRRSSAPKHAARREGVGLPNFLVIGAMKAGTTSLYHYLAAHPQIFMSAIKELDFFVETGNWKRGIDWYGRQFQGAGQDEVAIGEASTAYSKYPIVRGVPERIARYFPDMRLIYIVRNPIERIRSHYEHRVAVGDERETLDQAILNNPLYLNCSRYALQIQQYIRHFPIERLLLITSEDLRHSRQSTMRRVYSFLGVDDDFVPEILKQEFLRTSERPKYAPALGRVRHAMKKRVPASKKAKELVDTVLPRSLNRLVQRRHAEVGGEDRPIAASLESELVALLKDDVTELRSFMGDEFDGWSIA